MGASLLGRGKGWDACPSVQVNQLQFHPFSRLDVSEAIDWYQARSLRAAEQFALEVERVIERIAENPEQFAAFDGEIRRDTSTISVLCFVCKEARKGFAP